MDNQSPYNVRTVPDLDAGASQVNTSSDEYDLCEFNLITPYDIILTGCSSP